MDVAEYNKRIYMRDEKFGQIYDEVFEDRIRKIIGMLSGFQGKLLDVGCGDAKITAKIRDSFQCEAKGVELIQSNVSKARAKGIDTKKVDLNREKLPFGPSSFDAVFAGEVLEHVVDSESLLREMKRVLKSKGTLLVTVPNTASWYNRLLLLFGFLPLFIESGSEKSYGTPFGAINGHVKAFTKRSALEMLRAHGFRIEAVKGSGFNRVRSEENGLRQRLGAKIFFLAEKIFSRASTLSTTILIKAVKE